MSRLRVVAIDDEPLALDRLSALLQRLDVVEVVGRASGCATGIPVIARTRPDLLLLDIQMRDGSAFDLLEELPPDLAPLVVFVTAFPRYACRAFEVEALDYLLKPVEQEKLEQAVARAQRRLELTSADERAGDLERLVERLREHDQVGAAKPAYDGEIWVRHRGTDHVRIAVTDIDWIGVQDDYACIHSNGREHLLRVSLDRLMQSLDPAQFIRIHRSTVVRADRVDKVRLKRLGVREAVLKDGTRLPVGRIHARTLPWHG